MTPDERALLCEIGFVVAHRLEREYIDSGGQNTRALDHSETINRRILMVTQAAEHAARQTAPEETER